MKINLCLLTVLLAESLPKQKEKILFLFLFSVSYDFPGKADLINNHDFQELYLLF